MEQLINKLSLEESKISEKDDIIVIINIDFLKQMLIVYDVLKIES